MACRLVLKSLDPLGHQVAVHKLDFLQSFYIIANSIPSFLPQGLI